MEYCTFGTGASDLRLYIEKFFGIRAFARTRPVFGVFAEKGTRRFVGIDAAETPLRAREAPFRRLEIGGGRGFLVIAALCRARYSARGATVRRRTLAALSPSADRASADRPPGPSTPTIRKARSPTGRRRRACPTASPRPSPPPRRDTPQTIAGTTPPRTPPQGRLECCRRTPSESGRW